MPLLKKKKFFLGLFRKAILKIGVSLDTAGIPIIPVAWSAAAPYAVCNVQG
jgi:hypothetical protein